ncbi:MAG: hypothetical protein K8T26_18895 [Lentisphaerae bacterium]|nr:hypothetical protein [Lentisphaerota bacterium]
MSIRHLLAFTLIVAGIGCEPSGGGGGGSSNDFGDNDPNLVVAFGDSITEGQGLSGGETYPSQLAAQTGRPVINSGNGGEKSSGGLERVGGVLARYKPGYLLVLYGANDLIFDRDLQDIVANLRGIVQAAKANHTVPIIATLTPTFPYHDFISGGVVALNPLIKQMASEEGVAVADLYGPLNDVSLFQSDGLHPTAAGAGKIASVFAGKL